MAATPGRGDGDGGPDAPAADGGLPAGASGGRDGADGADGFDYDDCYGGYGDYADGVDDDGSDGNDRSDAPAAGDGLPGGASGGGDGDDGDDDDYDDDRAPWYSWERWKYIGGTLFLVLGLSSVGYVLWDIIDLLPKPVTVMAVRAALRESPGRITDVLALSGMISFGPPAGVDLMFGATKAAKTWSRKVMRKERAVGIEIGEQRGIGKGRAEERKEQRAAMHKRLSKFAGQGMTPEEVQQAIADLTDGDSRDGQK